MTSSTVYPLLINRKSGSLHRAWFRAWLRKNASFFRIIPTASPEEAQAAAHRLAVEGAPVIVAAGGDGTLMNIAQALIGTGSALGVLPCGTMNVFAREIGIGSHQYSRALKAIQQGQTEKVDIFTANGRPFLQMAGIGADAEIVRRITPAMKRRLGAAAHIVTGWQLLHEELPEITLHTDTGETYSGAQVIMGNGRRYGGAAKLFSEACYDDGLLDAVIVQRKNIGILLELLSYMLINGVSPKNSREHVDACRFSSATITTDKEVAYELDGDFIDVLQPGDELRISRLEQRLKVCVPTP